MKYEDALTSAGVFVASGATFVARVTSPWTQMGLEAWIDGARPRPGVVMVMPSALGSKAGPLTPTVDHCQRLGHRVIIVSPGTPKEQRRRALSRALGVPDFWAGSSRRQRVDIVGARNPDLALALDLRMRREDCVWHVLDEGFGGAPAVGWNSRRLWAQAAARRALLRGAEVTFHHLGNRTNLDFQATRARYLKVVERHSAASPMRRGPTALLVTSYLSELGRASLEDEARGIESVAEGLRARGYTVWLKPHPRERDGKYRNAAEELLDRAVPAESYLGALHASDLVVGPVSNVLYTAQVLFGLQVCFVPGVRLGAPKLTAAETSYRDWFPHGLPDVDAFLARQ